MKHIAAFLLLSLAKESAPTADDVKGLLSTVGIEADAERLDKLVAELDGKNVADVIAEGKEKLAVTRLLPLRRRRRRRRRSRTTTWASVSSTKRIPSPLPASLWLVCAPPSTYNFHCL